MHPAESFLSLVPSELAAGDGSRDEGQIRLAF